MEFIKPKYFRRWLDELAGETQLIAPQDMAGVVLYRPTRSSEEIAWEKEDGTTPQRALLSAKEALFPATERLLTIEKTGAEIHISENLHSGSQVVFGLRPCEARGLQALDALFIDKEPTDANYAQRRRDTILVSVACQEAGENCFCTSVGGSPVDTTGTDVLLFPLKDGWIVQPVTEKGTALLEAHPFSKQRSWEKELPEPFNTQADAQFTLPAVDTWHAHFSDAYWQDMAERCLSCRLCAYICPTCRCFDVRDEELALTDGKTAYERIRCWDSCASETYRRIAGGHNPRAEKGQRLRNRFYCKFDYFPEQYGPSACTGCGRCIDVCPVNIDITEVLSHLVEVTP
jgi:sulfhydrogenase subunit beta (sulfur reductase)